MEDAPKLWSIWDMPLSTKGKPPDVLKEGLLAANTALSKGLTHEEATLVCLQRIKAVEGRLKPSKALHEPRNIPEHVKQLLKQNLDTPEIKQKIQQALGTLPSQPRNLIKADFNSKNELVLTFDTGETLKTKPIDVGDISQTLNVQTINPLFDYIQFNTEANVPDSDFLPGMLRWNKFDGTLDLRMGDSATLQVGMEMYCPPALNNSGITIPQGSAVYASGGDIGTSRITFDLALAEQSFDSFKVLGVTTEDVLQGDIGFITSYGLVRTLDTTGFSYGEVWNSGDILYVSPTIPGRLTNIKPIPPYTSIPIAFVGIVAAVSGTIFVKPNPISRLDYGSFYDTTTQTHTALSSPLAVRFNTVKEDYGIYVADTSKIYCTRTGLYEFAYRAQLSKSNATAHYVWIWARVNGVDIVASANKLSVQGSGTLIVPRWSFQQEMVAGDYFQLMWAVDSLTIQMVAPVKTAFCPSTPSANITVVQINIS